MTDGRSTPQDLLDFLRARLPEYLSRLVFESLLTRVESIHLFGFPIRKPTNLILAYASVPVAPTGRLIQAKRVVDSATPDWQR